jgi:hypothetical protein
MKRKILRPEVGRLVRGNVKPDRVRVGLKARLARCDFTVPLSEEGPAEQKAWDEMKPVGREVL